MHRAIVLTIAIASGELACQAQSNPLSADVKRDYRGIRDFFIRAAERMPEGDYGFKPSPDVRTFRQVVAHVADDQYNLFAPAKGETRNAAYTAIEDSLSKKTDLIAESGSGRRAQGRFRVLRWRIRRADGCIRGGNGQVRQDDDQV